MFDNVMYIITTIALIGLAGLGIWIARQSFGLGGTLFQNRPKRVAIIETTPIDGRHRLLLVRRDNIGHLILTGGPMDVVVETGFPLDEEIHQGDHDAPNEPVLENSEPTFSGSIPLILQGDQPN
jgi:hypothetical protein